MTTPLTDAALLHIECEDSCCGIYVYDAEAKLYEGLIVRGDKMADLETQLAAATARVVELEADEKRLFKCFERIARAHGITTPLILVAEAKSNDESFAEILARYVEEKMRGGT